MLWNGATGYKLFNNTMNSVIPMGNLGNRNIHSAFYQSKPEESVQNPITPSSRFIQKGDHVRLTNASISFEFKHVKLFSNIRLRISGQNLLLISPFKGFDPGVNASTYQNGVPSMGIEYMPYPSSRSLIFSADFTL